MLCAGLMMSLHMKATMMKISDPIIFGHCVKVYFKASSTYYLLLVCCFRIAWPSAFYIQMEIMLERAKNLLINSRFTILLK